MSMSTIEQKKDMIAEAFVYLLSEEKVKEYDHLRIIREILLEAYHHRVEVEYPRCAILTHPQFLFIKSVGIGDPCIDRSHSLMIDCNKALTIQLGAETYDISNAYDLNEVNEEVSVDITDRMEYIRTRLEVDML